MRDVDGEEEALCGYMLTSPVDVVPERMRNLRQLYLRHRKVHALIRIMIMNMRWIVDEN